DVFQHEVPGEGHGILAERRIVRVVLLEEIGDRLDGVARGRLLLWLPTSRTGLRPAGPAATAPQRLHLLNDREVLERGAGRHEWRRGPWMRDLLHDVVRRGQSSGLLVRDIVWPLVLGPLEILHEEVQLFAELLSP